MASGRMPGEAPLFDDATAFVQATLAEAEAIRRLIQENEAARRAELRELREEAERARLERGDAARMMQEEFEEFVIDKLDEMFMEVEDMKQEEVGDDSGQLTQMEILSKELMHFKNSLVGVHGGWKRLVARPLGVEDQLIREGNNKTSPRM